MSQIQIKQIISSFVKTLDLFEFSPVSSEDFRLAKFNKKDVVKIMWRLLFELINYLKNNDPHWEKNFDDQNAVIDSIKREMIKLGYSNYEFMNLAEDFLDDNSSSREILIAIGWLISSYDIIGLFSKNLLNIYYDNYFHDKIASIDINEQIESMKIDLEKTKNKDLSVQLNYLKYFNGKFKTLLNSYYGNLTEKAKLIHKINTGKGLFKFDQFGLDLNHLSVIELDILKNPNKFEKYQKLINKKIELQENILILLEHEEVFWKWMESVADEKNEKQANEDDIPNELYSNIDNIDLESISQLLESKTEFEQCLEILKDYEEEIKNENKNSLTNDLMEKFATINYDKIKSYDAKLQTNFENIIKSKPDLVNESNIKKVDKNHTLFVYSKASNLKKQTNEINLRINILKEILEKDRNSSVEQCENLISQIDGCYIVHP